MRQILLHFTATAFWIASGFAAQDVPGEQASATDEAALAEPTNPSDAASTTEAELPEEPPVENDEAATEPEGAGEPGNDAAVSETVADAAGADTAEAVEASAEAPTEPEPVSEIKTAPEPVVTSSSAADEAARAETAKAINEMMKAETDALISRMSVMEQFLIAQHDREIELYRDTIRLVTTFGVAFAVIAGLGLLAAGRGRHVQGGSEHCKDKNSNHRESA